MALIDDLDREAGEVLDSLTIGRRIRQLRSDRGMTLEQLATAIDRAPSQLSVIENGKRELKVGELQRLARALGTSLDDLMSQEAPSRRAALEIALERAQRGPLYGSLGLPVLPVRKSLGDDAIEAILALHAELERVHRERAATPEEARRANAELRAEQRRRGNHFPELERTARGLLDAVGHTDGPLSQRVAAELAAHLGFSLHYVGDLPSSTRSVTDLEHGRIYLPVKQSGTDPRSALLQALAAHVLGKQEPRDYADLLRQRVETNYLAAAMLIPEASAVEFLTAAKANRELSVEDLRDAFAVTYETAAHRFTNLATEHLGIPVHFLKVHASGTISKAYENDGALFPDRRARRGRGPGGLPLVECPAGVHDRGPPEPVPPVHRQAVGHLLVHVEHPGDRDGGVLGERGHAVRARQVVPRARHHASADVALPRRDVLQDASRRPRPPVARQGVAECPPQRLTRGRAALAGVHRSRQDVGLRVPGVHAPR